jgi:hypothetical protein
MGFSNYLEQGILSEIFKIETALQCPPKWEKPKFFWIALCLQEVNDDDTGCTIKEPLPEAGYKRVENKFWSFAQMDFGDTMIYQNPKGSNPFIGPTYEKLSLISTEECPCGSDQSTEVYNTREIIFPKAKEDWGEIVYYAICDQMINGNVLAYGKLESPFSLAKDEMLKFKKGMMVIGVQGTDDNSPPKPTP